MCNVPACMCYAWHYELFTHLLNVNMNISRLYAHTMAQTLIIRIILIDEWYNSI